MTKTTFFKTLLVIISIISSVGLFSQASLPFSYDLGKPTAVTGLTHTGLGSDYSSSPKMKFDTTDDNLILFFNGVPGTLTFSMKWNQSTAATRFPGDFTLSESIDGVTYTVVQVYNSTTGTALANGTAVNETFTSLSSSTRYVKWSYTAKSNGNIAIGNINLTLGAIDGVAMPVFSVPTGNYITSQSVELTSATSGATIYYTIDGSEPTTSSLVYSSPINITSTTTIKAISAKSGMTTSGVNSAKYTFPTSVSTISELKSSSLTGFYMLTGEVFLTFQSPATYAKPKYVQDATGGILIYDSGSKITTSYNINEGITGLIGTLTLFNGMLELVPVVDPGAATSTGNALVPIVSTLTNLINYPGQLVTVNNLVISDIASGTGSFVASTNYTVNDGIGTGVLRTAYSDLPYITGSIPTTVQDITGVVLVSGTTAQLVPRTAADIAAALGTSMSEVSVSKISTSNGNLIFSSAANQTLEVYNAVGQKVLTLKTVEGLNTVPVKVNGVVFVKLGSEVSKVIM